MWKRLAAALCAGALTMGVAAAQEESASTRYMGCRAAGDGVDQRLSEICELVDEIHSRLGNARGQPRRQGELNYALSMALLTIGDTGDEVAMRDVIEASRRSADYYARDRSATYWAILQSNIGNAQMFLAQRGDEAARQEAVATFTSAIEVVRRERQQEFWASLHYNLANAHIVRGRGSDPAELRLAATALQSALEIYRGPRYPEERARAERRLAEIYRALGQEPDPT